MPPDRDPRQAEAEARFRIMADTAPVMIWMSGTDELCDWFNAGWLRFTGRTMAQELGHGWAGGVHRDDLDRCVQTYVAAFDAREPFSMEYRLRRHDGTYRWVLDNGTPRFDPGGAFVGYIGSCIDVHEHRAREAQLHDLLNRIGVMAAVQEQLVQLPNAGRIEFGQFLRRLIESLRALHQRADVAIVESIAPVVEVPMHRAVPLGLVANAYKHAFAHRGGAGRIEVALAREAGGDVVLTIADDGIGIAGDPRHDRTIGMRLIHALVEQVDGALSIRTPPGTTITVRLPAQAE